MDNYFVTQSPRVLETSYTIANDTMVIQQDSPHSDSSEDEIYSAVEFNELGLVKWFTIHSRIVVFIIVIISH